MIEKITFSPDGAEGEAIDFYVVEQTRLGGVDYILVTEEEDGDADAFILKDVSKDGDAEGVYVIVEDENELDAVAQVFQSMMDDVTLE